MDTLVQWKQVLSVIFLALLWALESLLPMFENHKGRTGHYVVNLLLGFFNAFVVGFIFAASIAVNTHYAREHNFGLLNVLPLGTFWSWVLAILIFDMWQYWWHRINHRIPVLWRFHRVHHSDAEMDASSAVRFHTCEIILSSLMRLMILPLIGMSIEQLALYEAILLPVILFHHSNVRIPNKIDRWLRLVIVTPWIHWVHHSRWQPETDSNYSSLFSWWDRLFGSFRLRDDPSQIELGLDEYEKPEWGSLWGLLMIPFRNPKRKK